MISITPWQHAKILGFAILGYGLQVIFSVLNELTGIWIGLTNPYGDVSLGDLLVRSWSENSRIYLFLLVSIVAGVSVLSLKSRSKIPGILFVLSFVSFFPLGTILSFYLLLYLFVISQREDISQTKTG